jgi:hypothetical protein
MRLFLINKFNIPKRVCFCCKKAPEFVDVCHKPASFRRISCLKSRATAVWRIYCMELWGGWPASVQRRTTWISSLRRIKLFAPPAVVRFLVFRPWSEFTWPPVTAVLPSRSNQLSFWIRRAFTLAHGAAARDRSSLQAASTI